MFEKILQKKILDVVSSHSDNNKSAVIAGLIGICTLLSQTFPATARTYPSEEIKSHQAFVFQIKSDLTNMSNSLSSNDFIILKEKALSYIDQNITPKTTEPTTPKPTVATSKSNTTSDAIKSRLQKMKNPENFDELEGDPDEIPSLSPNSPKDK